MFGNEDTIRSLRTILAPVRDDGGKRATYYQLLLISLALVGTHTASADYTFGTPTNMGPGINSSTYDCVGALSPDGLDLYFTSGVPALVWVAHRATVDSDWGPPVDLGLRGNGPMCDTGPSLSADGLTLYFYSDRTGGSGSTDIWVTRRATTRDSWGSPVNLGATVNSSTWDWFPSISADELELYFVSDRPGGFGSHDLYVTKRAAKDAPWGTPVNLGSTVNSSSWDDWPCISPDGLTLFFGSDRPGGYGRWDIYMVRRATRTDLWGPPVNLGPMVNTPYDDDCPAFSPDGTTLYISSRRPGGYGNSDIWQMPIIPIVDFNADGKVDLVDLVMLIDNWGTDKTLCDIGPMPWGDGKVDIEDLKVFMTYYEKENPPKSQDGQ